MVANHEKKKKPADESAASAPDAPIKKLRPGVDGFCVNCHYLDGLRRCRRNPPTVFGSGTTLRPIMDDPKTDWCGWWEAKQS